MTVDGRNGTTAAGGRLRRMAVDVLVWAVCTATAWPASAFASGPSRLLQSPPFTATQPAGNVFVMLDDSASMGDHQLPRPAGVTFASPSATGSTVTISGDGPDLNGVWSTRSWTISRDFDWVLRAPALNPLWYNPAVRYRPWNKDGLAPPAAPGNASIGGSTPTTHWGAITSRADAAQLTERDPRQAPTGTGYASVTAGAGRGLIGTDPAAPIANMLAGRRVTLSSPSVDFRYYKMPFDFGPALAGATSPPRNGHASFAWTTHDPRTSPLDLFSRPIAPPATTTRPAACYGSTAQCQSGASPLAALTSTTWQRLECDGTTRTYTSDPGPVTCHASRCGTTGAWSAWSGSPVTVPCDAYTWRDCAGVLRSQATDPGPIRCSARRQDCAGNWSDVPDGTAPLTCYRQRACNGSGWSAYGPTVPTAPSACYRVVDCAGSTTFTTSPTTPQSCPYYIDTCTGTREGPFSTRPADRTCWSRTSCTDSSVTQFGATAPNPLTQPCRYDRNSCTNVPETGNVSGGQPPTLTCWSVRRCDGTSTPPSETNPGPTSCPVAGEVPITYQPTSTSRVATLISRTATSRTLTASGGGTGSVTNWPLVDTPIVRSVTAGTTITATRQSMESRTQTRTATPVTVSNCPAGTSMLGCTISTGGNQPDPEALTPARYYRYTGTGSLGDPANYRVVQIDRNRPSTHLFPVIDAVTGVAATATTSQRTDCAAKTACTWVEEAQNFANWWLYYRNRLFAAQAVVADAMSGLTTSTQQQLRVGYGRINNVAGAVNPWRTVPLEIQAAPASIDGMPNPGALVRGVRPFVKGTTDRAAFFDWLFSLSWAGSTPNREAVDAIGRYFSWADDRGPWGATPGVADRTPQLACRRNFAFLTTDGEWTSVSGNQPLISASGPLAGPGTPVDADGIAGPTLNGDGPNVGARFTYRPTDWPAFNVNADQTGTLSDATVYYWNRDLRPDLPNVVRPITGTRPNPAFWQSMSTYIVGYGLQTSVDVERAREAAAANSRVDWPLVDLTPLKITDNRRVEDSLRAALASRGDFYAARDSDELRLGMQDAFRDIQAQISSSGGVAVSGSVVTGDTRLFLPSYETGKWTGTLRAYSATAMDGLARGESPAELWRATVPALAGRKVLTATAPSSGAWFDVAALGAAQQTALTGPNHTAADLVAYLRGDSSREVLATGLAEGRIFRNRGGNLLGDFVNSAPLYVRAPDFGFAAMPTVGASYAAHVAARRRADAATVYIGGNAGMLHAFDAASGVERFAYVPRGVYGDLRSLASPGYQHRYFVDGPVVTGDWHDGTRWRSAVIGSTGAGGAGSPGGGSIFALDIAQPGAMTPANVMWDITKADHASLGHVLGRGVVARVRSGTSSHRWVYLVGNGYESANGRAALLAIDMANGAVTAIHAGAAPPVGSTDPALRNGLGGITVTYDGERNVQAVYAGDRQGNLWRFDFSAGIPSGPKGFGGNAEPLFVARGDGVPRAITAAPRLAAHPLGGRVIVFGTGSLHEEGDPANVDIQAVYAIWEKPDRASQVTDSQLVRVAASGGAIDVGRVDWSTRMGWSFTLPAGERVVSDPVSEFGALTLVSFKPGSGGDTCTGGGVSTLYRLDLGQARVSVTAIAGVVGSVAPLTDQSARRRTVATLKVNELVSGNVTAPIGSQAPPSLCKLYGPGIQGQPVHVSAACPGLAPLRMWRQPTVVP